MDSGHDRVNRGPIVGPYAPVRVCDDPIRGDHKVAPELQGVLGRTAQPAGAPGDDVPVATPGPPTPDPSQRATAEAKRSVTLSFPIGDNGEREPVPIQVVGQVSGVCEGDQDNVGLRAEFLEAIADRDRMGRTGQSMNVTVEDQHNRPAPVIFQRPRPAIDPDPP